MSLYTVSTLLLSIFSLLIYEKNPNVRINTKSRALDSVCYRAFFALLLVMFMLCADRSPDYRAYWAYYSLAPNTLDFSSSYYTSVVHTEIGWKFLANIFKAMGFSFELFIAVVCGVSFLLLDRFVNRNCDGNKTLSIFWLYGSFCLSYYYIGIRMGLVISIFLGLLLPFLEEKKYIKYVIGTIFCTGFHTISILYILLVFFKRLNLNNLKKYLAVCVVIGIGFIVTGRNEVMYRLIPTSVISSLGYGRKVTESLPLFQFVYRLLFLGIAIYCYYSGRDNDQAVENYYKYYFSGMMFYLLFAGIPTIGTRVFDMVKPLEVVFISRMIGPRKRRDLAARILFIVCFILCIFMVFYHINAIKNYFVETSEYTFFSFPFRSVLK